ncbi:hypothetical protein B0H13DRAFT_1882881 [Mycena leptocephala]|nr:hypothetical protein B0H13DRAFT_1882881 [Mycena leptocephala]
MCVHIPHSPVIFLRFTELGAIVRRCAYHVQSSVPRLTHGKPFLAGSLAWLASALSAVLIARLMLNMREVADAGIYGTEVGVVASEEDDESVQWNGDQMRGHKWQVSSLHKSVYMVPGKREYVEISTETRKSAQTGITHSWRLYASDFDPKICPSWSYGGRD